MLSSSSSWSISFLRSSIFSGRNLRPTSGAIQLHNLYSTNNQINPKMGTSNPKRSTSSVGTSTLKPDGRLQQLLLDNSAVGWEKSWEEGVTPWDLGRPTPILVHLHQTGDLPKGRALFPGCGSGYDVAAVSGSERFVVGLDISESCVRKANELHGISPNAGNFTFVKADFFTWKSSELFDLIFDYTFFCAIEPCMRVAWAKRVAELLKPDGELMTLMFPISDHDGGPPFKVSVTAYEEVLHPLGFQAISVEDNKLAIGARKGREKLGRWKRSRSRSPL